MIILQKCKVTLLSSQFLKVVNGAATTISYTDMVANLNGGIYYDLQASAGTHSLSKFNVVYILDNSNFTGKFVSATQVSPFKGVVSSTALFEINLTMFIETFVEGESTATPNGTFIELVVTDASSIAMA
jgi:hypothetical protein